MQPEIIIRITWKRMILGIIGKFSRQNKSHKLMGRGVVGWWEIILKNEWLPE